MSNNSDANPISPPPSIQHSEQPPSKKKKKSPKSTKPSSELSQKRDSAISFWKEHGPECQQIKSIKEVYGKYKQYCTQHNLLLLNEYIFRTYIRKPELGKKKYCNS